MKKAFKITLIVLAVLLIVSAIAALFVFADLISYTATGVEIRTPMGVLVGKALVVYNPGLSGAASNAASKIANGLKSNGYEVTLAGVRSAAAANTTGFNVIVVGGPIYAGKPTGSIQAYLNSLNPPANASVGVFGIGQGPADSTDPHVVASEVAPLPSGSTVTLKTVMKIATSENLDNRCSEFVTALLH
jgi:flavorubredoxin